MASDSRNKPTSVGSRFAAHNARVAWWTENVPKLTDAGKYARAINRLSPLSLISLSAAQRAAKDFQQLFDVDHLLLGVLQTGGIASDALAHLDVTRSKVQEYLKARELGASDVTEVLDAAVRRTISNPFADPHHILLALVESPHGLSPETMAALGITREKTQEIVGDMLISQNVPESGIPRTSYIPDIRRIFSQPRPAR